MTLNNEISIFAAVITKEISQFYCLAIANRSPESSSD